MLKNYFRIALRNLQRNKSYMAINILGLALSICCAIVIFLLVRYHLDFDKFHAQPGQVYRIVTEKHRDDISYDTGVPNPLGESFRNDYAFAKQCARILYQRDQLVTIPGLKEPAKFQEPEGFAFVEKDFFDIFNFPLIAGNKGQVLNDINTAIITQKLALKYFGNENPIGRIIKIDNRFNLKITGVLKDLPATTDLRTEIYASFQSLPLFNERVGKGLQSWDGITSNMQCFIRLQPGIPTAKVETALFGYVKIHRAGNKNVHHYKLQPLADIHFNGHYSGVIEKNTLWVLSAIGFFLIITACVNFVNLATAQAINRSKEVGVRKVLGSLRSQIAAQFIAETSIISIVSILLGVIMAQLLLPSVNRLFDTQINTSILSAGQLLIFLPILLIIVIALSGFYPAIILSAFQPVDALKGKRFIHQAGGFNTRRSLIVAQFVISQVLIIGMIVIISQMNYARQTALGFNKDAILMIPAGSHGPNDEKARTLKTQLQRVTGVEMVSACFAAPSASYSNGTSVTFESRTESEPFRFVGKPGDIDYLKTFDLTLVAGRNFFPSDTVKEYIVNEMFARKMNIASPAALIGKMISVNGIKAPIAGVVKDFHDKSFYDDIHPIYIANIRSDFTDYAVKINMANAKNTLAGIGAAWSKMYPEQIFSYQFLDEQIARFYATDEKLLLLVQTFSVIAIFICSLGLYGLVSFMAAQKTKEIGIRKVLGSSTGGIIWIFGKEFSTLILVAFLIASPLAWFFMNKWLQDFKFRIDIGANVFLITIVSTFVFAALTVSYQAIKAALMNPVKSLRTE